MAEALLGVDMGSLGLRGRGTTWCRHGVIGASLVEALLGVDMVSLGQLGRDTTW